MVTITFQCESIQQLREQMMNFLSMKPQETFPVAPSFVERMAQGPQKTTAEVVARNEETMATYTTTIPEKTFDLNVTAPEKKRTRRSKAEIEADKAAKTDGHDVFQKASQEVQAPEEDSIVDAARAAAPKPLTALPQAGVSKEVVHQALQQVNVAAGLPKAREILQSFKANRVSEIKETDFKAFVDKCNEAVMMN